MDNRQYHTLESIIFMRDIEGAGRLTEPVLGTIQRERKDWVP